MNQITKTRSCVIVLGMHRSGTSALTRVLNLLGCGIPKTIMPGNEGNVTGHWESKAIYEINESILASAASSWHDWREFNKDWYQTDDYKEV